MFFSRKVYLTAHGGPSVLVLTHDVKRCLSESKAKNGLVSLLSTQGTTAVVLMENDVQLQKEYLQYLQRQFEPADARQVSRRSGTGPNFFHHMAALAGLGLYLAFESGRLLSSPHHEVLAFDFEPKPGHREFVISIVGE